jgi:hypothetical protein
MLYSNGSQTGCRDTIVCRKFPPIARLFGDIIQRKDHAICHLNLKIMVFCLKNYVSPRNNFTKNVSPTKKG